MKPLRIFCLIIVLMAGICGAQASPKREMRGVWVATVWGLDWPSIKGTGKRVEQRQKAELIKMLDEYKRLNFTTVCLQVRSMGDVFYPSRYEPWSAFLTGTRGADPGWDPLEFAVEECHKRGLELYAWVNPFRWSTGTAYNTSADQRWKKRGWLMTYGKYTVFNPGLEEVRLHLVEMCREIVDGYDVDGLVFDDYFYPNRIPADNTAPDYKLYKSEAPWMTFSDWRRACVHKAVADVKAMIADTRPGCRFGISPAGVAGKGDTSASKWGVEPCTVGASDWQYEEIYSDPLGLMYQGTVDFISPQIYWSTTHSKAPFGPLVNWWAQASCRFGSHLYSSITLERVEMGNKRENINDAVRQIDAHRRASIDGNCGIIIYSSRFLPLVSQVVEDRFATRSLPPVSGRSADLEIESPKGLRMDKGVLRWSESSGEPGELMRYTVYAIPPGVGKEDAQADDGDGLAAEYLQGVTYLPEFKPEKSTDGWRYAVCVYTPQSAESAPTWLEP
ncbi:MAG: family 10 glycosylhydrolase [Muribaculaceae bacterium]|nr:family 10 glycosylhydrolase [Muribaculaceae bacterium]